MAYCAQTDLDKVLAPATFVQLADDDSDGIPDAAVVTEAIAQADAEIDGYLGARYTIPVSPVPALLRQLSTAISVWRLYGHRRLANERARQDYDDAIKKLEAIAKGVMVLPATTSGEVATDGSDLPQADRTSTDRTMTLGKTSADEIGSLDNY